MNTPVATEVARVSIDCNASTSFRFCCWNTRRTMPSAFGEVTRRPPTVCFSMPAADSSSSSCGPAPCSTIGVSPTCCRKVSDEARSASSSRSTAPPTFTTAKRLASTSEKRLRYCWISFALPMLESRRTMVLRVCLCVSTVDDPVDGFCVLLQLVERDPLVGAVRLGDVAGTVDEGGAAGGGEQCSLGPEVHGVADRDAQFVGEIARDQPVRFGVRRVASGQGSATEGLDELHRLRFEQIAETDEQMIRVHRGQGAEAEANLGRRRDHVRLDAALDAADVEAQPGESAETLVRLRRDEVQCRIAPAHRLVQRAVTRLLFARSVPRLTREAHQHRLDAAMRQHRLALRRLGYDCCLIAPLPLEEGLG